MSNLSPEIKLNIFYAQKLKTMSIEQLERWKSSPTGLLSQIYVLGRNNSKHLQSRLQSVLELNRQACWEWACEKAWGWDQTTKVAKRKLGSRDHLEEAERLCVQKLYAPPHYRVLGECVKCGAVLLKAKNQTCPWCITFLNPEIREKAWQLEGKRFGSLETYHPPLPELVPVKNSSQEK